MTSLPQAAHILQLAYRAIGGWLFLDLLGIGFSETKSGQDIGDKTAIMKDFNDPKSDTRVCVTSFKNTAVGVNMLEAYHGLVMMSAPKYIQSSR